MGLEVNADTTKHMVMSRDTNPGRNHSIKIDNNSFERVEEFKYLGKIRIKIVFGKKLRADGSYGMLHIFRCRMFFSSSLLSKNIEIKIYRSIILPVVLYWRETS